MLQTIGTVLLPIIGGYLLSKVDPIALFFSPYLTTVWQLPAVLSIVLLLCVAVPYYYNFHKSRRSRPEDANSINNGNIKSLNKIELVVAAPQTNNDKSIYPPVLKNHVSSEPQKIPTKQEPLELSPNHIAILKVFRSNDGELTSVPLIEHCTGLETIVISSILDELEEHKLINPTNLDELYGGWQYQLSTEGRKTVLKFT